MATLTSATSQVDQSSALVHAIQKLRAWMEPVQFAGYEPYDILNAPVLKGQWARTPPFSFALIQFGKRVGGLQLRRFLKIPASRNPKALGLCLAGYCDLARMGHDVRAEAEWLKAELIRLRSPQESDFCWGYDWDFMSLRGTRLPAFSGNCIASCFCGAAMLEMFEVFGDREALEMAKSVARFLILRLNRSFESEAEVCFSYTPNDRTLIFNNSALAAAFVARGGRLQGNLEYLSLAKKGMAFSCTPPDAVRWLALWVPSFVLWIDSFHTSYNVCALLDYQTVPETGNSKNRCGAVMPITSRLFSHPRERQSISTSEPFRSISTHVRRRFCILPRSHVRMQKRQAWHKERLTGR